MWSHLLSDLVEVEVEVGAARDGMGPRRGQGVQGGSCSCEAGLVPLSTMGHRHRCNRYYYWRGQ